MARARDIILVVDDDPAIIEMIADGLNDHYEHVLTATTPAKMEEFAHLRPDFALLDYDLGFQQKTGIELGIELIQKFPSLIVVIMTGYQNLSYAIEAMRQYNFHYMIKPFRIDQIISLFERARFEVELLRENQLLKDKVFALEKENQRLREIIRDIRPEEATLVAVTREKEYRQRLKSKQAINSYRKQKDQSDFDD